MRQCDDLDGLVDGIINNYVDCRAIFNVNDGVGPRNPWAAKHCTDNVDPNPEDASQSACLTLNQIETLELTFSDFAPGAGLANGRENFGMWAPSTAVGNAQTLTGSAAPAPPSGSVRDAGGFGAGFPGGAGGGLLVGQRYHGQEGAASDAPVFSNLGSIGVIGFILQDLEADPLTFDIERVRARREQASEWLDSTDPDLSGFKGRGGKLVVIVGTDDTTAPSGEQLNFYQTILDHMGRAAVDSFARFYVLPQTGHGLSGRSAPIDGEGNAVDRAAIPNAIDRLALLRGWVENGVAPARSQVVTGAAGTLPMCSYPEYPRYVVGDASLADSYICATPESVR
jgi:feruloyl esterase